jgi:putative redox protein
MAGHVTTAQVVWVEGMQFVAKGGASGGTFIFDGSPDSGGRAGGVRPMETLLLALAGCTGMDVVSILQKKRQEVTGLQINLQGLHAEEHPRRYQRITVEFVVRGRDVAPEAVARAIELSREKYCSVAATLNSEIVTSYRVEPA